MVDERFRWKLDPDVGEFISDIQRSNREILRFGRTSSRELERMNRGFRTARNALLGFTGALSFREFLRSSTSAITGLERIRATLAFATGSAEAAGQELMFLREESDRLGLALRSSADGYGSLLAAARGAGVEIEALRDLFLGTAEASVALNLGAERTEGILFALEQIISKGVVSAEEIRRQMGDRLPGAFQIAARSMGVTTQRLDELLRSGDLLASEFIPAFGRELRETFGSRALANADNLVATLNRLETAGFDFLNAIGEGGLTDGLTDFANRLSEAASEADGAAEAIGTNLGLALNVAADAAIFLGQNLDTIGVVAATFIAVQLVRYVIDLAIGMRAAAIATVAFSRAIAATPIGAFALAVAAIAGAIGLMATQFNDADTAIDNASDAISRLRDDFDDVGDSAGRAADEVGNLIDETARLTEVEQARREWNRLQTEIDLLITTMDSALRLQAAGPISQGQSFSDIRQGLRNLIDEFRTYGNDVTGVTRRTIPDFEAGLDSLGRRFEILTGQIDNGRARLQAFVSLENQINALDMQTVPLRDIIFGSAEDEGGAAPTGFGGGGGSGGRSGGSSRDRFADRRAALEEQIEAEQRLQAAVVHSNEAIEDARTENRLLADIRRIEAQFTGEQREELVDLTRELARQAELTEQLTEKTQTYRDAQELVNEILNEGVDEAELYNAAIQVLKEEFLAGKITAEQFNAAVDRLNERFSEGQNAGQQVGSAVSEAFSSIVSDIESAEDAAARFLLRMAEIILQARIFGPLEEAIGGAFGGSGGGKGKGKGGGGGFLGFLFGGGRAEGGDVRPGLAFRVGERGPETFVPAVPGVILPQGNVERDAGPTVNVSINTSIDATGADPASLARVERKVENMERALPGDIVRTVASEIRRGGPMSKATGIRR